VTVPEVSKKAAAGGEEDEGRSRAMKPPTPRLAAVETAEQAQKLRVVGEEHRRGRRRLL
jgi:hypothetical protein